MRILFSHRFSFFEWTIGKFPSSISFDDNTPFSFSLGLHRSVFSLRFVSPRFSLANAAFSFVRLRFFSQRAALWVLGDQLSEDRAFFPSCFHNAALPHCLFHHGVLRRIREPHSALLPNIATVAVVAVALLESPQLGNLPARAVRLQHRVQQSMRKLKGRGKHPALLTVRKEQITGGGRDNDLDRGCWLVGDRRRLLRDELRLLRCGLWDHVKRLRLWCVSSGQRRRRRVAQRDGVRRKVVRMMMVHNRLWRRTH